MDYVVASQYDERYADAYEAYYLNPWARKHNLNVQIINTLLGSNSDNPAHWLDLFCGQGWHFAQIDRQVLKTGVDLSAAQIERARSRNPEADFLIADVLSADLPDSGFDLVTCFWAAYCYLGSIPRIGKLLDRAVAWTRPGGSLYFEILLPGDLLTFNSSEFAKATGFRVTQAALDDPNWAYTDYGGTHRMVSPPLSFFEARLAPHFTQIVAEHDGGFMTHLRAQGRIATEPTGSNMH